jgi:tetratricopeptide (TPR) repeat protein
MKVLGPAELNTVKKVSINVFIVILIVAGIVWLVQYNRIKQKNLNITVDKSGHIVVKNDKVLPIDLEAHELIARRYIQTDQPEKALVHLQRVLPFELNNRPLRYELAAACLDAGHYDRALTTLDPLERDKLQDSLTPKICALKGIALFYLKKIPESKECLSSCLSQFPKSAEAACFLGQIEASENPQSPEALAHLETALANDSLYVEGWYQLARYKMVLGDYKKARQLLLRGLEIDPLHVKSHSRLGMVYYYLGNYELAKKSYVTALALNPMDFNTRYNLAELYYTATGDTENALREFTITLKQNPLHSEANFKVGLICMRNNMIKEAIRYFETALETDPANVRILLQRAVAYEKLGDRETALNAYKTVHVIDPLNPVASQKIKYLTQ